jgi:polysaccharide pyruvyl transferase WcaK-like protein
MTRPATTGPPAKGHSALRLHIGHHFFGSGNLGDDLMLAGFLALASRALGDATFSCCSPFDRVCQERRFPQVQWLPYDPATRASAIEACDAWLGVGDTPFQTDVGSWFLDHLIEEVAWCRRFGKPMFFLAVGLNNRQAIAHPHTRTIVAEARHIWTRDLLSARFLREIQTPGRITAGSDLAHAFLVERTPPAVERDTLAFLLNFEDREAFSPQAICDVIDATPECRHLWLVQEVRTLTGSERDIYSQLPESCRARLEVRAPDYALDSLDMMLERWGTPERLITSRYHGALVGSWLGSRTVIIERNDKLTGLVEQLALASAKHLRSAALVVALGRQAAPLNRGALDALAGRAALSVEELAAALSAL